MKRAASRRVTALVLATLLAVAVVATAYVPSRPLANVGARKTQTVVYDQMDEADETAEDAKDITDTSEDVVDEDAASGDVAEMVSADDGHEQIGDHVRSADTEDVPYEPNVALVRFCEGATPEEVSAALASVDGVRARNVTADEVALGLVRVELEPDASVEGAVEALRATAPEVVVAAQPNYIYGPAEALTVTDLKAELVAAGEPDVSMMAAAEVTTDDLVEDQEADRPDASAEPESTDEEAPVISLPGASAEGVQGDTDAAREIGPATDETAEDEPAEDGPTEGEMVGAADGIVEQTTGLNDAMSNRQWGLESVGAYAAWDAARGERDTNGRPVTIAVLDVGFDTSHPDLRGNVVAPYNAHTSTGGDAAVAGPSHGTHVAGIVAACANNGIGIAGVSYNAKVMPIRVTDGTGGATTEDFVRAYTYLMRNASAHNVRVVNISMGSAKRAGYDPSGDDEFLRAIERAYRAGIVTVAAAGNYDGRTVTQVPVDFYPADNEYVVSVINLARNDTSGAVYRNDSSNYNAIGETDKNVSAPGTAITSTITTDQSQLRSELVPGVTPYWTDALGGYYRSLSGTSMAAPFASGVLALEFAANPSLSAVQAKSILYASARDLGAKGFDAQYGWGEVSASEAVAAARGRTSVRARAEQIAGSELSADQLEHNLAHASISSIPRQAYTGRAITPALTVVSRSGRRLVAGRDYATSWSNNVKVGTASVTVRGAGFYTGSKRATFVIYSAAPSPSVTGAKRVPVGATATYTVANGRIAIKSGASHASLSGRTLTAKSAGTVVLAIYDANGYEAATRQVSVYTLSGTWMIASAINGAFVADIAGGSLVNGGNLQIYRSNGTGSQRFSLRLESDGCVTIRCARTGKVLDVAGGSKANGGNVRQYASNATAAQRWRMSVDSSNRVTFVNKGSALALDVAGGRAANGVNVRQYRTNGSNAQKWTLTQAAYATGVLYDGIYRIASSANRSFVIDVAGGSRVRGGNVQVYRSNGTVAQQWRLEHVRNGLYRITNVGSGLVLDVQGGGWASATNVWQWVWNGTTAQLWKPVRNADGSYTFRRNGTTSVLDVAGGRPGNGVNLWQYRSNGTAAQHFFLTQY